MMKKCSCCKLLKPLSEFNHNRVRKDGYHNECKTCSKLRKAAIPQEYFRESYQKNKHKYKETIREYRLKNKDHINEKSREWRKNHPRQVRNYELKRLGTNIVEYESLFNFQEKKCGICQTDTPGGRGWCADHDHVTGIARGVLCNFCNTLLGFAKDNIEILQNAIIYLKTTKARQSEITVAAVCT